MPGHRVPSWLAVLLVLSVALGGCTGDDGGDDGQSAGTGGPGTDPGTPGTGTGGNAGGDGDVRRGLGTGLPPTWFIGLTWTWEVSGAALAAPKPLSLLVSDVDDESWHLAVQAEDDVVAALLQHGFPSLLRLGREDLGQDSHVALYDVFDFPIEDQETWEGTGPHGDKVTYTAMRDTAQHPDGRTVDAYLVRGLIGEMLWIEYTYSAAAGYITTAYVDSDMNGEAEIQLAMTDVSTTGDFSAYDRLSIEPLAAFAAAGVASNAQPAETFTVTDAQSVVLVHLTMQGDTGVYQGAVTMPDGTTTEYPWRNQNSTVVTHYVSHALAATAGDGTFGSVILGQGLVAGTLFGMERTPANI